jgi:hypothetical protein
VRSFGMKPRVGYAGDAVGLFPPSEVDLVTTQRLDGHLATRVRPRPEAVRRQQHLESYPQQLVREPSTGG